MRTQSAIHSSPAVGFRRHACFAGLVAVVAVLFYQPLRTLLEYSPNHQHYSHIPLIPLLVAYLIWSERKDVFQESEPSWRAGAVLLASGFMGAASALKWGADLGPNDYLAWVTGALLVAIWGLFILVYGTATFCRALFPLLFGLFAVPIPSPILDRIVYALQVGSTWVTVWIFGLTGIPFFRDGFVITLPGISIEVAEECSGIRSSIALLISGLLAVRLFLRSHWRKAAFIALVIPMTVIKNGIRIVTLTLLAMYVDPGFLTGNLHRRGGIVFFLLSLILLAPALLMLQRGERREERQATVPPGALH